ncbi:FAD-dependent monooxygenase [Actinomycetospora endophytica]|uniref:FAD-dependent monooxygenase n=1 Tax=Actinomycetospora endophytica TaxID=2291215 RepID=A0ABS8P4C9_9PSEU|nr:FAD-dependent monooxygenase [Actinomycetospora endophytica]MCD2192964.1 FAD-dependent monooxygenase [Actinomycetospora endophytica]
MHESHDVTVVGAGPVGLVLAAELALAGASVQVLERLAEPAGAMKAQGINVPTAEALDRRGLLPAAEAIQREVLERIGVPAPGADPARPTGHFAGMVLDADLVDWSDPDLAAHAVVAGARMVPQPQLEALLAEHVARLGVPIRRRVEVTALEAGPDGVVVGTTAGTVHTRWVVGCDGGHSAVRRLAGIDFPGTDPEITGYQAVADIADAEKLADGWVVTPRGAYRCGPQPGRVAVMEFDDPPADRTAPITVDDVQASLRRVSGTDVTLRSLRGAATRWTDNARQAATYRSGRILLAGDAAHVHPPFGGQGLNLGVGDAMNLGWKLAAVLTGRAPDGLLDTYDVERRPVGAWVLDWTRAQTGVMRGDAKSAAVRGVVADLLDTRDGTTYAVKQIAGVTQRVDLPGDHPLVGRFVPDLWLADGSRLADHGHDGGFLLLDRSPDGGFARLAAAWGASVVGVADEAPDRRPTGVLVRPDGVVAWATDSAQPIGLEDALHRWAGAPEHQPVG